MGFANQVVRVELHLQATLTGTDVDVGKLHARVVDVGGEKLLHADGRAAPTDVAGEGQQLLHVDEVALLVAAHLGCQLEVDFVFAGDDADEVPRAVTPQHEGLEDALYVFAQLFGHVGRAKVVLVHLVGNQFVLHPGLVHQAGSIGLVYLFFRHKADVFLVYI